MALVKTLSMERRPLMLKDYLRNDLSSCSSSCFKSFPRRQCCTTIRFLIEIDLKTNDYPHKYNNKQLLQSSRSKATASKTISALQRASGALLNAVKLLPFPSVKSSSSSVQNKSKKGLLPTSLSCRLLKRSFWRKAHEKEEQTIKRWKMFGEYLEEQPQPSDQFTSLSTISKTESNSCVDSDFTADVLLSSSSNSESSNENDVVESKKKLPDKKPVGDRVGVSVGEDSITNSEENTKGTSRDYGIKFSRVFEGPGNRHLLCPRGIQGDETDEVVSSRNELTRPTQLGLKQLALLMVFHMSGPEGWRREEEEEQFSPVSVLDYPFEDEKDINYPPFQHGLARIEGSRQRLMQKLRRFERLAKLEPIDLEKRIASFELDNKFLESSAQSFENEDDEEENETDEKVKELLKLMKSTASSSNGSSIMCKAENLLSDFFREKLVENKAKTERDLLKEADDWINGQPQELLLGWEVKDGRKAYVKDMEKNHGKWWSVGEEREKMGLALELEIFTCLVNELLTD